MKSNFPKIRVGIVKTQRIYLLRQRGREGGIKKPRIPRECHAIPAESRKERKALLFTRGSDSHLSFRGSEGTSIKSHIKGEKSPESHSREKEA